MIVYYFVFFIPALAVLSPFRLTPASQRFLWLATGVCFAFFVGLRHEIGTDWPNYQKQFYDMAGGDLPWSEPSYSFLNYYSAVLGFDIHAVNLVCGIVFTVGLFSFCWQERLPWLALVVAVPYLMIVVGMGYTKQAAGLGLLLWGLVRLQRGQIKTYVVAVLLATTFHTTALVCLIFAALRARTKGLRFTLIFMAVVVTLLSIFIAQRLDALYGRLANVNILDSSGAAIRLTMNVVSLAGLLAFRKRWQEQYGSIELWVWMGGLSAIGLAFTPIASTAVDRVALYFLPLQIVVWSRLPTLMVGIWQRTQAIAVIIIGYAAVLAVWLNFGNQSHHWLPYQNVLVEWLLP